MSESETSPKTPNAPTPAVSAPAGATPSPSAAGAAGAAVSSPRPELRVVVRPLPKVVFFYLTWIASFFCGLLASLAPGTDAAGGAGSLPGILGLVWVGVFFFNLLVISFDFNEERSLALVLGSLAAILALLYFGVLGSLGSWLASLRPVMNATFYWIVFTDFTILFFFVWLNSRLDYWEFRPNEVVHRYGIFPKMKRFSTDDLRWDKEVPDVFERLLLGSGRILLTTPHERQPIVIQHVVRIGRIDDRIADILGVKAVVGEFPASGS